MTCMAVMMHMCRAQVRTYVQGCSANSYPRGKKILGMSHFKKGVRKSKKCTHSTIALVPIKLLNIVVPAL